MSEPTRETEDTKPLADAIRALSDRDRQLRVYQEIARVMLSSYDLEVILDEFSRRIVEAGILRSVMLALVDQDRHEVVVVRSYRVHPDKEHLRFDPDLDPQELADHLMEETTVLGFTYDLDDDNITAAVARTGEFRVLESPSEAKLDKRFDPNPDYWKETRKIAYFVPVKHGDRVVAVMATGSLAHEREQTINRFELMQPLFGLFAIALQNARLLNELKETNQALVENERKLIRLERHRALGEMSAGISHNLNNILTGVIGPAQLLTQFSNDPMVLEEAAHIIRAGERAQDLVYRLYRSAKGDTGDVLEGVDVNGVVAEAIKSAMPRWKDEAESRGAPIEIMTELADVPRAYATSSGLNDILINLIFNAIDAMEVGGTITITTALEENDVVLKVADTGDGMDPQTAERVFEPFFTTKQDVGTGLGLSTVYGTLRRWGGRIEVDSRVGEGTTFTVWLPVDRPRVEAPEVKVPGVVGVTGSPGRLLIVDDDETAGRFLLRTLQQTHQAEWVNSGGVALQRVARSSYDVALIDLGMPGMPGDQLVQHLKKLDPTLATILITGWHLDDENERRQPFDFFLQKPFNDIELLDSIVRQAKALHDGRAGR